MIYAAYNVEESLADDGEIIPMCVKVLGICERKNHSDFVISARLGRGDFDFRGKKRKGWKVSESLGLE